MWFDYFNTVDCSNCYACIRVCPVNAIEIKNEHARIIEERCIICDECFNECPQRNKVLSSEIPTVKQLLKKSDDVVVSIAPSFPAIWGDESEKLPNILKSLGFKRIEDTLVGVEPVIKEYERYLNKDDDENYISSLCPTIVNLIEKHYPDLIKNLIPVDSAFISHAKLIKEKYGKDTKVTFIGPCLGKKDEGRNMDCIDAVITFEELKRWLKQEKIYSDNFEKSSLDEIVNYRTKYPFLYGDVYHDPVEFKKEIVHIDGIKDCIQVLKAIQRRKVSNTVFQMNFCKNGCIGGTGISPFNKSNFERKLNLKAYNKKYKENLDLEKENPYKNFMDKIDLKRSFQSKYKPLKKPTDQQIKEILKTMGMFSKADEINCKACGYNSCRDKARAIFNNLADNSMCIPYLRKKSESRANVLFSIAPNLIAIINNELCFEELNPAALRFFKTTLPQIKNTPISKFFDEKKFKEVRRSDTNIIRVKTTLEYKKSTIIENIIWLPKVQIFIWIADDITQEEIAKMELQNMKVDAINMAQYVIDKQMKVAQEIASLLGETTAETKVTLTRLKELVDEEGKIK